MGKIGVYLKRLRTASVRRLNQNIQAVHKETGRNRLFLLCDMIWCSFHYGVGYLDYHVFGFANNRGDKRKTYMTMNHNIALSYQLNQRGCTDLFNDKIQFLAHYTDYVRRDWIDLRTTSEQVFENFCRKKGTVFAKLVDDYGGHGVERIDAAQVHDFPKLYRRLNKHHQYLIEEAIVQHEEMNRICARSVNTIRVVTVLCGDEAKVVYTLLRMGCGHSDVDNISSGGLYTLIPCDGVLRYPAFCDFTGKFYTKHPKSNTELIGFHIPCYHEALELCCQAALRDRRLGYVGWDVAITPEGPILVEANHYPGYDMAQNAAFSPDGIGLLPKFESLLGRPIL